MENSFIKIVKSNHSEIFFPKRSTKFSAGYDVFAVENLIIPPRINYVLELPVSFSFKDTLHKDFDIILVPRSSYGIKKNLRMMENDTFAKYIQIKEISDNIITIYNDSNSELLIPKKEHFLQFVIINHHDKLDSISFEKVSKKTLSDYVPHSFEIRNVQKLYHLINHRKFSIAPDEQLLLATGFKANFPRGSWMGATISSEYQKEIIFSNSTPVVDADYYNNKDNEGLIFISLKNISQKNISFEENFPILEFWAKPFYLISNEIPPTDKRNGGIGSTNN